MKNQIEVPNVNDSSALDQTRRKRVEEWTQAYNKTNLACGGGSSEVLNPLISPSERMAIREWQSTSRGGIWFFVVAFLLLIGAFSAIFLSHGAEVLNVLIFSLISTALVGAGGTYFLLGYSRDAINFAGLKADLRLCSQDKNLHFWFHESLNLIRKLDPPASAMDEITEAEEHFNNLIFVAAEFHDKQLDQSSLAKANRQKMVRLTADMTCLSEVLVERQSLLVALESKISAEELERAEHFAGLAASHREATEEKVFLKDFLGELA